MGMFDTVIFQEPIYCKCGKKQWKKNFHPQSKTSQCWLGWCERASRN